MQAGEVEPVEVSRPPELSLLQLLLVDCLISERHDTKVGLGWEEASIWFQEHVTCDYVGLEHALIKQECSQWLTDYHVDRLEWDRALINILYLLLDDRDHVLKSVVLDEGPGNLRGTTRLNSIDLFGTSLRSE